MLFNNAGYGQMDPVELIPPAVAQQQFAVNFHASLLLSQYLILIMRSLGGRISPTAGIYSCSKFALEALSEVLVLRRELKAFKIQVSVVEPDPVVSDFFRVAWQKVRKPIPNYENTPYVPVFKNI